MLLLSARAYGSQPSGHFCALKAVTAPLGMMRACGTVTSFPRLQNENAVASAARTATTIFSIMAAFLRAVKVIGRLRLCDPTNSFLSPQRNRSGVADSCANYGTICKACVNSSQCFWGIFAAAKKVMPCPAVSGAPIRLGPWGTGLRPPSRPNCRGGFGFKGDCQTAGAAALFPWEQRVQECSG